MMSGGSSSPAPSPPRFPGGELPDRLGLHSLYLSSADHPRNTDERLAARRHFASRQKQDAEHSREERQIGLAGSHPSYSAERSPRRDQNTRCANAERYACRSSHT